MESLRNRLNELLDAVVIVGPLLSEDAMGWISKMVTESKIWDPKIRLTLDTRMMGDFILQTNLSIPTSEHLRHEFAGSDRFSFVLETIGFYFSL